jgi:macrolide-specific efflux system membrane fusion protein
LLSAILAVIVAGGIAAGVLFTRNGGGAAAATVTTTNRLVSASTGTVTESVSATGTLTPAEIEDVSFGSSAEVTSVKVAQGATVTKGQVLGTIDTVALKAALATAKATLAQARSTLATAQDSSSTTDVQLAQDKLSVTSAKSARTAADDALAAATLRSPISGTVAEVNVATGDTSSGSGTAAGSGSAAGGTASTGASSDTAAASGESTASTTSGDFVVIGTKAWTASASVDDTEVGLIAKGDQAQITTDNVTGTVFGTVSSVAVLASSSSGSAGYPVTIAVTGSPSGLHDGASATISIVYKQVSDVLTVPAAAVHADGTTKYVYVSTGGKKVKKTVKTGLSSAGTTQITSGLSSGDQVYVETVVRTAGSSGTGRSSTTSGTGSAGGGNAPAGGTGGFPGAGAGGGFGGFGGGN